MVSDSARLRGKSRVGPYEYLSMKWWGYYMATGKKPPTIYPDSVGKTYDQPVPPAVVRDSTAAISKANITPVMSTTYNSGNCRSIPLFSGDGGRSWCAAGGDNSPSITLNAGKQVKWTAVATQGREGKYKQYVKKYKIKYSVDGTSWVTPSTVYTANTDQGTAKYNTIDITAQKIAILPIENFGHYSMRMEAYFKPVGDAPVVTTPTPPPTVPTVPISQPKDTYIYIYIYIVIGYLQKKLQKEHLQRDFQ